MRRLRSQIFILLCVSSFIFKENHVLIEEGNSLEKNATVEKELDGIDINSTGNSEDC